MTDQEDQDSIESTRSNRRCMGPHGWCGTLATVVCTADDGLQWYACDVEVHRHGARTQPLAEWWAALDRIVG